MNWRRAILTGVLAAGLSLSLVPRASADPPPWAGKWRHHHDKDDKWDRAHESWHQKHDGDHDRWHQSYDRSRYERDDWWRYRNRNDNDWWRNRNRDDDWRRWHDRPRYDGYRPNYAGYRHQGRNDGGYRERVQRVNKQPGQKHQKEPPRPPRKGPQRDKDQ